VSALAVLTAARALVERGWTQGEYARHKNGRPIGPAEPNAVCWCATGAIMATGKSLAADLAVYHLGDALGDSVLRWNDTPGRTQAEVLALFDRAIARLS
jgi:hypothetical protein